jgi:hypothetical protein
LYVCPSIELLLFRGMTSGHESRKEFFFGLVLGFVGGVQGSKMGGTKSRRDKKREVSKSE